MSDKSATTEAKFSCSVLETKRNTAATWCAPKQRSFLLFLRYTVYRGTEVMERLRSPWKLLLLALVALLPSSAKAQECENVPSTSESCAFSYPLPPMPTISVSPGGHVVMENGSHLLLACNILAPPTTLPTTVKTVAWEFNGTLRRTNSSTLDIIVSEETAGKYRCIVGVAHIERNNSLVTAVSDEVLVEPPRVYGWVNEAATEPTNQSESTITEYLSQGGFAVLECQPNTNFPLNPSSATVTWLRNKVMVPPEGDSGHLKLDQWRLLVRNFTLHGAEREVSYECIVAGLRYFNQDLIRKYSLAITEEINSSVVLPVSQVAVFGDTVTFYCFPGTGKLSEVSWLKNGASLNYTGYQLMDSTGPLLISEMLVVRNVSAQDEGLYSCVGGDGVKHFATLTVVSPPTNAIITSSSIVRISNDVITNGSTVNLTCLAESGHPSDFSYQWYFRGEPVSATYPGIIQAKDNVVTVSGGQYGTVQCFASNLAGTVSASVVLLNKPRPPINLSYTPKYGLPNYKLIYGLNFTPPKEYIINGMFNGTFYVKTYTHRERANNGNICTAYNIVMNSNHTTGGVNLHVQNDAGDTPQSTIRMEVALQVGDFMSDYVALRVSGDGGPTCDVPIDIQVIEETFISERNISQYPLPSGNWSLKFQWAPPKSAASGFLNHCQTSLVCSGEEPLSLNQQIKNPSTLSFSPVPSCSRCVWNVTYSDVIESQLSNSVTFTTNASVPTVPPNITSISRAGKDGRTIEISFIIPHQSCSVAEVGVHYSLPQSNDILDKHQLLSDNCILDSSPSSTSSSYTCKVLLEESVCGKPYIINLTYANMDPHTSAPLPGDSPVSEGIQIPNIEANDLNNTVIRNMALIRITHSTSLLLHLNYSEDLSCLLNSSSTYNAEVCWVSAPTGGNSCTNFEDCEQANQTGFASVSSLKPSTTYTFIAVVRGPDSNSCGPQLVYNTSDSMSVSQTRNSRTYVYATVAVFVAVLLTVLIIIILCFVRRMFKKKTQHHYSPFQEEPFREDAPDPINIHSQRGIDVHSETTSIAPLDNPNEKGKDYIMRRYLYGHPDGSADEPSTTDDEYLCHSDPDQESDRLIQHDSGRKKLQKQKKKFRRKKARAKELEDGMELKKETSVGGELEMDCATGLNNDALLSDTEMNERNQMEMATTTSGLQGMFPSHQNMESGYVRAPLQEQESQQEPLKSIPFTPPIIPLPILNTQGEETRNQYVSEQTLQPSSSTATFNNISTFPVHAMPLSPDATPTPSQATPLTVHPTYPATNFIPLSTGSHSEYVSLHTFTEAHSSRHTPSSTVDFNLATPTAAPLSLNSGSGYIPNTPFPHYPPALDRTSSSGNNTTSSGYVSQSIDSSGYDNQQVGIDTVDVLDSSYIFDPLSTSNCLSSQQGVTSVYGNPAGWSSTTTGASEQDEACDVRNPQVDDDSGSLSSNSVFSTNISFQFSKYPLPDKRCPFTRPSEGYSSMPTTPTAAIHGMSEDVCYVNVDPEQLKDVNFEYSNKV